MTRDVARRDRGSRHSEGCEQLWRHCEGASTMHDDEEAILDQAGDGSPHGRPSDAVHVGGKILLGR